MCACTHTHLCSLEFFRCLVSLILLCALKMTGATVPKISFFFQHSQTEGVQQWASAHVQWDSACLRLCMNVCILTLGLLTLAWGLPADAGAMLIQVEQPHQPFGSCFQLYHLRAGLHHTHASLHCREKRREKTQTLGSVEHFIKIEGTGAWLYSYQEEAWWSVTQLAQQLMWVWVQKCNRDGTVWTHRVAVLSDANICLKHPREHANEKRPLVEERTDRWRHVTTIIFYYRNPTNMLGCTPKLRTVDSMPIKGWPEHPI